MRPNGNEEVKLYLGIKDKSLYIYRKSIRIHRKLLEVIN